MMVSYLTTPWLRAARVGCKPHPQLNQPLFKASAPPLAHSVRYNHKDE